MHKPTPSMTMTRTPGLTFEERRVLRLLANHTYDEVVQETGWSRGRIYNLAIRVGASDQRNSVRTFTLLAAFLSAQTLPMGANIFH